jgi:EAL domain-containing protein (putative c-di-GMP-specific phosphodiesterase class I)
MLHPTLLEMLEVATERGLMEADMRLAIERSEFHLVYQPLLDLTTDIIFGFEALIRWDHPRHGPTAPVNFIPLAEQTGQIVAIGAWVLQEACRQAATWPKHVHVAVNISPAQFRSPLLIAHVTAALANSGLRPGRLELELTETAMISDGPAIRQVLVSLRELGVTVAMDDFGTGYSSLSHLRDFPLDRIKIDRSFVSTAATDRQSMAILRAVTQLGDDLGIPTLGEGVETTEQLDLLRSVGCHAAQGYLVGKPTRSPRFTFERPLRSA